jgi:hypothetical protein
MSAAGPPKTAELRVALAARNARAPGYATIRAARSPVATFARAFASHVHR